MGAAFVGLLAGMLLTSLAGSLGPVPEEGLVGGPLYVARVPGEWRPILEAISGYASPFRVMVVPEAGSIQAPVTAPTAAPMPGYLEASGGQPAYSPTNVQVPGVDEPDVVKVYGDLVLVAKGPEVLVFRAYPPEELGLVERINVSGLLESVSGDIALLVREASRMYEIRRVSTAETVSGIHVREGRVYIVVTQDVALWSRTWILSYELGEGLRGHLWVAGVFRDSRLYNDTLVVVSSQPPGVLGVPLINGSPVDVGDLIIVGPPEAYTNIVSIDLESWEARAKSVMGPYASAVYASAWRNLYVAFSGVLVGEPASFNSGREAASMIDRVLSSGLPGGRLGILKFSVDGGVELVASAVLEGYLRKQWQMDEWGGYLRVVLEAGGRVDLYVLNSTTLETLSALEGIAVNENVHAIRFMGERLYLVTFRAVDPLFAIDLSNPLEPRILGFLEAPGFDEYLHPIGGGLYIGVGREEGAVRVTLYRVSDRGVLEPLDRVYFGLGGSATTPVLNPLVGHRAFIYHEAYGYVLVPIYVAEKGGTTEGIAVVELDPEGGGLAVKGVLEVESPVRGGYIGEVLIAVGVSYSYQAGLEQAKAVEGRFKARVAVYDATTLELLNMVEG